MFPELNECKWLPHLSLQLLKEWLEVRLRLAVGGYGYLALVCSFDSVGLAVELLCPLPEQEPKGLEDQLSLSVCTTVGIQPRCQRLEK